MKLNYTRLLVLTGIVLLFAACNKNGESLKPGSQSTDASGNQQGVIAGQIVSNLVQSLSGSYGGIDIKSGINKPNIANASSAVPVSRFHSLSNSLNSFCSFFVDSTLNYDTKADTIQSHTGGKLKFYFNCNNGSSTGYTASDSIITAGKVPGHSFYYVVDQYYMVSGLNANNTLLSANGYLTTDIDLTYDDKTIKQTIVHNSFVLTNLAVDLTNNGDITSGSATFNSIGGDNSGSWNFNGTIVFLGNHKADISLNNTTYHVDLTTGKVS